MTKVQEGPWTYYIMDKFDMSKHTKLTKSLFNSMYDVWREQTSMQSNTLMALEHPLAVTIKEEAIKNDKIVGWIIDRIDEKPCIHSACLLACITKCNPIPKKHSGYTKAVCRDWVKWYDEIYKRRWS